MSDLIEILIYPIKQVALLLFSLSVEGMSVGSLIVAAVVLGVLFRLFIGSHMVSGLLTSGVRRARGRQRKENNDE